MEFTDPTDDVTFLFPNKKVTKEVVRGEALRANAEIAERLPPASDLFRFAARNTTSPRTPLPPRKPPPTENVPIFSGLYGGNLQVCRM